MTAESPTEEPVDPSAEIAAFVSELEYGDLPEEAVRLAERCFVDTVGVGLAGASAAAGSIAAETAAAIHGASGIDGADSDGAEADSNAGQRTGEATLFGGGAAPVAGAAFVNGTASHALDYDDLSYGMDGHPSTTTVAPILAIAEAIGATGAEAVTAYVASFETQCYVAAPNLRDRTGPGLHSYGWHPTGIFGTFGAAAAVASLLELDAAETRDALNIAASSPAGLMRNFGSLSKPMHAGQAAAAGVRAAFLARGGFDATADALREGFLPVYERVEEFDPEACPALGAEWAILEEGVDVKKYPSCYASHTSIYATAELVEENGIDSEDVERIHLEINGIMEHELTYDDPETEAEAKFSLPYPIAAAVVFDRVGIETFEPETIHSPEVQRLRERVDYERDPDLGRNTDEVTVTIETVDGEAYSRTQVEPPATHENPISDADLREKFLECATRTLDRDGAEAAHERLDALRRQDDIRAVTRPLGDSRSS